MWTAFRRIVLVLGLGGVALLPAKAEVRLRTASTPFAAVVAMEVTSNDACAQGSCSSPCQCDAEPFVSCKGQLNKKCRCPALR